ncbi:TdeIII family type II restriction endonuclease [Shewanella eurypsychrophilus]|uniref:type II site-specific deoxyribonuclease n=1 Tax=Shewanella eurypsychrophilus TaxID=2593656 RepID=A0ABX6VCL4_9GAMM|nr:MULTISPECIES: TdeIII family type II restriction endonuclease [Shewanella]QPG60266.2 TdeIII family type II restriction endonuclease [Shewanella eurypsychrophilus]
MKDKIITQIKNILQDCVSGAIQRTEDRLKNNKSHQPFHRALLPEQIVKISSFERSFSTSFGQGPVEKISEILALNNGFEAKRQHEIMLNMYKGAVDEVERIGNALREGNQKPNWGKEVKTISSFSLGDSVVRRVISDLWLKKDSVEYFISIKTVKPNLDQSEKAKKDMLFLKAANVNCKPIFALYYNPYGLVKSDYNHSIANKLFNMHIDECVMIGEEYWDFIGGKGTYKDLIKVFQDVGVITKKKLLNV